MRDNFTSKTKETLAKRVNYLRSNPRCRKLTIGPNSNSEKSTLVGVAAHISAASTNGLRYSQKISKDYKKSIKNAIWLCCNCSVLIDKDEKNFTIKTLRNWKSLTEKYVENKLIGNTIDSDSKLLAILRMNGASEPLHNIVNELFEISILYSLEELKEFCTREINGWYCSELPDLNSIKQPEYRIRNVLITFREFKHTVIGQITATQFLAELGKSSEVFEQIYSFHEPIGELENNAKEMDFSTEQVLRQEVAANQLNFNDGGPIEIPAILIYSSKDIEGILSDTRKHISRTIMKEINHT